MNEVRVTLKDKNYDIPEAAHCYVQACPCGCTRVRIVAGNDKQEPIFSTSLISVDWAPLVNEIVEKCMEADPMFLIAMVENQEKRQLQKEADTIGKTAGNA